MGFGCVAPNCVTISLFVLGGCIDAMCVLGFCNAGGCVQARGFQSLRLCFMLPVWDMVETYSHLYDSLIFNRVSTV